MIFHQMIAEIDSRVTPLERVMRRSNVAEAFDSAWTVILEQIDYVPIFSLAREVVRDLVGNAGFDDALKELARAARRITARRAALRHDLMGRIYHRLLAERKYFGAYYTTIPAAVLLLRLTLDPEYWSTDFGDVEQVRQLRISDLACGTGTLLKAALQTAADNHVRARADRGFEPEMGAIHKALVEEVLWGFDVIPFAIHLAASALALHEPSVTFGEMNLRTMPLGLRPEPKLGSLEFLFGERAAVQADLFGGQTFAGQTAPEQVTGRGARAAEVTIPPLDLCVMNPPFTRSVGGNLLFGNLPTRERKRLQKHLRDTVAGRGGRPRSTRQRPSSRRGLRAVLAEVRRSRPHFLRHAVTPQDQELVVRETPGLRPRFRQRGRIDGDKPSASYYFRSGNDRTLRRLYFSGQ